MSADVIQANWQKIASQTRAQWGQLAADDLGAKTGRRAHLGGKALPGRDVVQGVLVQQPD